MKIKIVSIILAFSILFTAVAIPASAEIGKEDSLSYTLSKFIDGSTPMPNVGDMVKVVRSYNKMFNEILGVKIFSEENFNLVLDETMSKFSADILKNSGVDFSEVYFNFPKESHYAEWIDTTFSIDVEKMQTLLNNRSNELYSQNKSIEAFLIRWISAWIGVIDECELKCVPVEGKDGVYEITLNFTYRDGRTDVMYSGLYLDTVNQMLTNKTGGPAVIGYYLDINQAMTYTGVDTWQRIFGFMFAYDFFVYLNSWFTDYVTQRIKFEYNNMEWMCQIWKGKYLITNGGEVGFYNRPLGSKGTYYNCAGLDELMDMTLDVYHGDDVIVHREKTPHWWITGFTISDTCYKPITLTLVSTITMRDEDMLEAFTKALDCKKGIIKYEVNGLDVTIVW